MKNESVRVTLRIPPDLHAKAVEMAKISDRSLNGQIVFLTRLGVGAEQEALERSKGDVSKS